MTVNNVTLSVLGAVLTLDGSEIGLSKLGAGLIINANQAYTGTCMIILKMLTG